MAHAAHSHDPHDDHGAPAASHEDRTAWPVALLLMIATTAIAVWALVAPRSEPAVPAPPPAAEAAAHAAPDAGPLGAVIERALANHTRIAVPERGVEGRLVAFIEDANRPADKTTWFDFDRLTFETGAATLHGSSQAQLDAVAAILGAYPAVKLKIGGYTDDVGAPEANQKLSEERARNVRSALIRAGVDPERLSAEGYGEQFPIGDNATEEGRATNRRISMRVVEK